MLTLLSSLLVSSVPSLPQNETPAIRWWQGVFDGALARAESQEKRVVSYFWVDGSTHCASIWADTLQTPEIATELSDWMCVSVDVGQSAGPALVQRFRVATLPTLIFLTPEGEIDDAVVGYIDPTNLTTEIRRIEAGRGTVSNLRQRIEDAPDDLQRYLDLAVKLRDVGLTPESQAAFQDVRDRDPEGATIPGARLALWDAQDEARKTNLAGDVGSISTAAVQAFLADCVIGAIRFEGWEWVANIERESGRRDAYRAAIAAAWPDVPSNRLLEWGSQQATFFWETRDELDKKEKKLALQMASAVAASAETQLADPNDREYSKSAPQVASALNLLARCQLLNGKRREAKKTIERCIELDPEGTEHPAVLELIAQR